MQIVLTLSVENTSYMLCKEVTNGHE